MTEPFIGLNDLGDVVGEDLSTSDSAVIAINIACETVRGFIDNQVNLLEETIVLDGSGRYRLVLPRPPVRSVSNVVLDDETLVEGTDFELDRAGMLLRLGGSFWTLGLSNVEVTYEHGWDVEEPDDPEYTPEDFERVPADLRGVALALAKRVWTGDQGSGGGAIVEESIGAGDYKYKVSEGALATATSRTLLDDERFVLERYRAPVSG